MKKLINRILLSFGLLISFILQMHKLAQKTIIFFLFLWMILGQKSIPMANPK
jgi:hypothetical protein